MTRTGMAGIIVCLALGLAGVPVAAQQVTDRIFREEADCNTYLFLTSEGCVVVDPGGAKSPDSKLLAMNKNLQAILLTHAHADHIGGIALWKKDRPVPVIAQREHRAFLRYMDRMTGFFAIRNAIIAGENPPAGPSADKLTPVEATVFFSDEYVFKAGDLTFKMIHTSGETPDTCLIWVPELKAVCMADNYFAAFPNLATPRGSQPRFALDYIHAMEIALSLEPAFLLPGHGEPVTGAAEVKRHLTRYREAVVYVHDATVRGINQGKDPWTLMREIKLPPELQLPEFFGRVSWAVRGICQHYTGWFDGDPANLYGQPPDSIYPELLELAGGPEGLARRANELAEAGDSVKALHLANVILHSRPENKAALEVRLKALSALAANTKNFLEKRFLEGAIRQVQGKLKQLE